MDVGRVYVSHFHTNPGLKAVPCFCGSDGASATSEAHSAVAEFFTPTSAHLPLFSCTRHCYCRIPRFIHVSSRFHLHRAPSSSAHYPNDHHQCHPRCGEDG